METFSPLAAILNVFWHVLLHDQMESRVCFPNACTKENSKKPCRNNNSEGWTTVCVCVSLKRGTEEQKNSVRKSITPLAFFVYRCQLSMQKSVLLVPKVCFCACASDYRFLSVFDLCRLGSHPAAQSHTFGSMLWAHMAECWRLYAKKYTNNISSHGHLKQEFKGKDMLDFLQNYPDGELSLKGHGYKPWKWWNSISVRVQV